MDDYLTKPVDCKTLLKFIGRIARRSKRGTPRGVRGTPPEDTPEDKGGGGGDAASCSSSPATDIPALEAHFRARVRKITRSLQQGAQRAQLSIVQIEADQLLGLSVLPELRAVRGAVQRVLRLSATDPAAACAAVAEVVAAVRAAFGTDKDKDAPSTLPRSIQPWPSPPAATFSPARRTSRCQRRSRRRTQSALRSRRPLRHPPPRHPPPRPPPRPPRPCPRPQRRRST